MYVNKEEFKKIAIDCPEDCNAYVTKYTFGAGHALGLFDYAVALYLYANKLAKDEKDVTVTVGFAGFKKLVMKWSIQNPVSDVKVTVEAATEIAKEMTINLRKYYDRAQLVKDYKDDIDGMIDSIEAVTFADCKEVIKQAAENRIDPAIFVSDMSDYIVFLKEEK